MGEKRKSRIFNPLMGQAQRLQLINIGRDFRLALLEVFQRCASIAAKVHRGFNGSIDTEHYTRCILTSILDPSAMLVKCWNTLLDTTNIVSIFTAFERPWWRKSITRKYTVKKKKNSLRNYNNHIFHNSLSISLHQTKINFPLEINSY